MPNPNEEYQRAQLSLRRGKLAANIKDSVERKKFIERQSAGKLEEVEMETSRETNRRSLVGNYKRGGKVAKTGLAKVHKGERVLTETETHAYDFRLQKGRKAPLKMRSA